MGMAEESVRSGDCGVLTVRYQIHKHQTPETRKTTSTDLLNNMDVCGLG